MKKLGNYIYFTLLFALPLLLYPIIHGSDWRSDNDFHAILEFASFLLATTAGIMVLIHFLTTGNSFFLVISCGLILLGAEELLHGFFSFERLSPEFKPTFLLAVSATWLSGNLLLLLSMAAAPFFDKKVIKTSSRRKYSILFNLISFIVASAIVIPIFYSSFLPDFFLIGSKTKIVTELSLGFLFLAAFIFYLKFFRERVTSSPIINGLAAFLIIRILVHIYISGAHAFYDSNFDFAHLLVLISYLFPIFGVWSELLRMHNFANIKTIELAKETTEHRKAIGALKESEAKLKHIFSNISDVIYSVDVATKEFNYLSPSFTRITGYTTEDIEKMGGREKFIQQVVNISTFKEWDDFLMELNEDQPKNDFSHATFWLCKDGAYKCLNDHWIPIFIDGKLDSTYGILSDITERLAAEQDLKEKMDEQKRLNTELEKYIYANQELKQFAYLASHQLQEPIRTVANFSKIIEEDFTETLGDNGIKHLHIIRDASKRMATLMDTLLDYSQLGRSKSLIYSDCSKLVESVIFDLDSQITEAGAEIEADHLPYLYVYEVELLQLLQNLISNAIKFRKKNVRPVIKISSLRQDDKWRFSVSDNGIGIDNDQFEKIFDLFKRLHIDENEFKGNGIGLAYCKKIVQIHQGEIWVESGKRKRI